MVTSHDVARLAGVSQPTVSRALRDNPNVSEETRARVAKAARELGYVPSATGRALSLGRSHRVGLLVTDLTNQFYRHMIAPIHNELGRLGYELILMTDDGAVGNVADRVAANGVDGVVLATASLDSPVPLRLRDRNCPFVYFNRTTTSIEADSVVTDANAGIGAAVTAMVELGHRRIGIIHGPPTASTAAHRSAVLRATLARAGVLVSPEHEAVCEFETDAGFVAAQAILASSDRPTVLVCANDVIAFGALNAAVDLGLRIPDDISIVGFDNLPETGWPILQLSTVAFDLPRMARKAATLVTRRISEGPDAPYEHVVFPTRFIHRGSLGPAPR